MARIREEDVEPIKEEIRAIKSASVSSTRSAIRAAAQAEENGLETLRRLESERDRDASRNLSQGTRDRIQNPWRFESGGGLGSESFRRR